MTMMREMTLAELGERLASARAELGKSMTPGTKRLLEGHINELETEIKMKAVCPGCFGKLHENKKDNTLECWPCGKTFYLSAVTGSERRAIKKEEQTEMARARKEKAACSVAGCGEPVRAKGFCASHYLKKLREERRDGKGEKKAVEARAPEKTFKTETKTAPEKKKEAGLGKSAQAALGQLLYASDKLDAQIVMCLRVGVVNIEEILDIRMRLGAVVTGRAGESPA